MRSLTRSLPFVTFKDAAHRHRKADRRSEPPVTVVRGTGVPAPSIGPDTDGLEQAKTFAWRNLERRLFFKPSAVLAFPKSPIFAFDRFDAWSWVSVRSDGRGARHREGSFLGARRLAPLSKGHSITICRSPMNNVPFPLTAFRIGQTVRLCFLALDAATCTRLRELGVREGCRAGIAATGDKCVLRIGASRVALQREVAMGLFATEATD